MSCSVILSPESLLAEHAALLAQLNMLSAAQEAELNLYTHSGALVQQQIASLEARSREIASLLDRANHLVAELESLLPSADKAVSVTASTFSAP